MEFVTAILFVQALFVLGGAATLSYLLRIWPLHGRLKAGDPEPRRLRRGAWLALLCCALVSAYGASLCMRLEHQNRQAGGFLPTEYHPKGWRWSHMHEGLFRMLRAIPEDRPLTAAEQADYEHEVMEAERINALHETVEDALCLYVLVPMAFVWLAVLMFARGIPLPSRLLSAPAMACLLWCGHVLVSLDVFTALMGD